MKKKIIAIPVILVSDISELSAPDGSRQLDFPYFVENGNSWEYCMINERTDPEVLMKQIAESKIFIYFDMNNN